MVALVVIIGPVGTPVATQVFLKPPRWVNHGPSISLVIIFVKCREKLVVQLLECQNNCGNDYICIGGCSREMEEKEKKCPCGQLCPGSSFFIKHSVLPVDDDGVFFSFTIEVFRWMSVRQLGRMRSKNWWLETQKWRPDFITTK